MTIMRIHFAGQIMKAEHKQAGPKNICDVSLCKKHKGRDGGEDTFTWLRATIWEPPEWMAPRLVKGSFIAGSGELQLRSFEHKGEKRQSLECRCTSFDIEVSDGAQTGATQKPQDTPTVAKAKERQAAQEADGEPPF